MAKKLKPDSRLVKEITKPENRHDFNQVSRLVKETITPQKPTNFRSKPPLVKKSKENFLLLLLAGVQRVHAGEWMLKDIANSLGLTKQALNYHLNRFRKLKVLEKTQSYPFSIYKLTDLGSRLVKEILRQSDRQSNRQLWKSHNLIIGFRVKKFGEFKFVETSGRRIIKMNNWIYAKEVHGDFTVDIHATNPGLIKIYCPPKHSVEPDAEFGRMYGESQRIAQDYCDRYKMELYPMHTIRRGQKSLMKSEKIGKILGRVNTGDVWVDASEGTDELEEREGVHAIEDLLTLPKQTEEIRKSLEETRTLIMGSVNQQTAISNSMLLSASTQKALAKTQAKIGHAITQQTRILKNLVGKGRGKHE